MERGFLIDISVLLKGGYGVQSGIDLYDVIENERFIFEGVVYNPSKKSERNNGCRNWSNFEWITSGR